MKTVTNLCERDTVENAILAAAREDGTWLIYQEGDKLPDMPIDIFPNISVSAWQIRKALNSAKLRDAIETAVTVSKDRDLKDGWEFAAMFDSSSPLVIAMGEAIGKKPEEIYELFQLARVL